MASLDIRPHSPRVSGWVVAGLMLLGAGAFAAGVVHQLTPAGPPPFPPAQQDSVRIAVAAPPLEFAQPERPKPRPAPMTTAAADAPPAAAIAVADSGLAAQTAPGADASANAPDSAPAAPAPSPTQAPADADPPT